ncbi:unnamed protein product [Eretmochelys imbricata]
MHGRAWGCLFPGREQRSEGARLTGEVGSSSAGAGREAAVSSSSGGRCCAVSVGSKVRGSAAAACERGGGGRDCVFAMIRIDDQLLLLSGVLIPLSLQRCTFARSASHCSSL